MEYFFTDTGEELPEVYEFISRLEGYLGKEVNRINSDKEFSYWMKKYNNYLPSAQQRWCTRNMNIIPLEHWIRDDLKSGTTINSYVAIRYDEPYREGHQSKHDIFKVILPFQKDRIDRKRLDRMHRIGGEIIKT